MLCAKKQGAILASNTFLSPKTSIVIGTVKRLVPQRCDLVLAFLLGPGQRFYEKYSKIRCALIVPLMKWLATFSMGPNR